MLDPSSQSKRHALAERKNDCYETPAVAVEALLRIEQLPHCIWEPACGSGNIVNVLRRHGHEVIATDLIEHGCERSTYRIDFLLERKLPGDVQAIVTNPPFKLAKHFVIKALDLCPFVIMLLRLAFLESECRSSILDNGMLARVHVFRKRLPMMHRLGWQGNKSTSAIPFAWFVWNRDHIGPTMLHRISWEKASP